MVTRRALVTINGRTKELPTGDTLAGAGGGGAIITSVEVNFTSAARERTFNVVHVGALVGQNVIGGISLNMPAGVAQDEIELNPLIVSGYCAVAGQVRLTVASARDSLINGKRNIVYQLV